MVLFVLSAAALPRVVLSTMRRVPPELRLRRPVGVPARPEENRLAARLEAGQLAYLDAQ